MNLKPFIATISLAGLLASPALAGHDYGGLSAHANFHDNEGNAVGEAHMDQGPNGVLVTLEIEGLPEGKKAIHIHGKGTCEDHEAGFKDSGGHLNPDGKKHGLMNEEGPDAGDFNNFYVHDNGYGWAELFNPRASLDGSYGAKILDEDGAALVIHENPDNHVDQPIGGAGSRIACAVIEPH
ncbi:MAG: superoxide dismutase family protein [Oleiphilaceae bacterium]|nr:superoxide dismutase family protein [Oleiphilaceae bacterium]